MKPRISTGNMLRQRSAKFAVLMAVASFLTNTCMAASTFTFPRRELPPIRSDSKPPTPLIRPTPASPFPPSRTTNMHPFSVPSKQCRDARIESYIAGAASGIACGKAAITRTPESIAGCAVGISVLGHSLSKMHESCSSTTNSQNSASAPAGAFPALGNKISKNNQTKLSPRLPPDTEQGKNGISARREVAVQAKKPQPKNQQQ